MRKSCKQNKKMCCPERKMNRSWRLFFVGLLFVSFGFSAKAQFSVSGVVSETNGETMPGVNVVIKGTTAGVVTDMNGKYTINVLNAQAVLVFSFVGYVNQEIQAGDRRQIDVTLQEDTKQLEEVVVMGYYTQAKRDVTGAITSVSDKTIAEKQAVTVFDALQGAAPGVQILSNSGAPGGDMTIRIRGTSTLSDAGVNPLYIVDGIQMSNISSINPDDIKSMEILKDAASASIYGSRSANGVVIITTKQGEAGKPRFDFKYLNSYSSLAHKIPQSSRLERAIFDRSTANRPTTTIGLDSHPTDSTSFNGNADNDYQDLMTQTAMRNQFDLSVSGGSDKLKYRASVQYLDDEGIILNTFYKRLGGRFNIDYLASEKLSFRTNFNLSYTDKNNTNEGRVIQQALQRPPQFTLYYPDGSWMYDNGGRKNPVAEAYLRKNETEQYRASIYQDINYNITPWLKVHGDIALNVAYDDTETFNSKLLETATPPVNTGESRSKLTLYTQGNLWVSAEKSFGDHTLQGFAGGTFEKNDIKNTRISGRNFPSELITSLNGAGEIVPATTSSDLTANTLVGFYGRIGYDYLKRYLFNATIRADGSSRFGKDNRWGYFPSVSLGWRFSDEPFMQWAGGILSDGKLRGSLGVTGNQAIEDFDAQTTFVIGSYTSGSTTNAVSYNGVTGIRTDLKMGNTLLKWESTTQYNAGVDLMFLNGKVSFTADYYVKNTKDLLFNQELPLEVGYSTVRTNLGEIQNKGIELMVTWNVFNTRDFSWTTTGTWSRNKNKIVSLPGGDYADEIWWIGEGSEAGTFYGWKNLGIYSYNESNAWTSDFKTRLIPVFEKDEYGNIIIDKQSNPTLTGYTYPDGTPYEGGLNVSKQTSNGNVLGGGDVIWQELPDSEGIINGDVGNDDRQKLGHGQPSWYAGWQNTLRYKSFTLSFSFYASIGGSVYNEHTRARAIYQTTNVTPSPYFVYNTWKYPGQITDVYRRGNYNYNNRQGGDYFLEDASFIRLTNIRLTYNLRKEWAQAAFLENVQVYAYANNLFTWTNYSGFDPEVNQNSVLKPGEDDGKYPRKREIGFGINIGF